MNARRAQALVFILAGVVFFVGLGIGLQQSANLGTALWIVAFVLVVLNTIWVSRSGRPAEGPVGVGHDPFNITWMSRDAHTIYEELVRVARDERTTYYGTIAPMVGLDLDSSEDRESLFRILDGISRGEHREGRPLLSAVVVRNDAGGLPGAGFFRLARELGLHEGGGDEGFWVQEVRRVHQHWSSARGRG